VCSSDLRRTPGAAQVGRPRTALGAVEDHVVVVVAWCDIDDDDNVVLNSAEGRAWPANLRRAGRATVTVMNMANPLEYLSVVGRLDEDTTDGADDVIDALSRKYTGGDYDHSRDEQRVTFRLVPERVTHRGG